MNNLQLKDKAAESVIYLGAKRILIQVIFSFSNILLARILFPEDFGIFAIIGFVTTFFVAFCDLGFGPSMVQKDRKISIADLRTAFTFQMLMVLMIIAIIFLIAPTVSNFYQLGDKGILLLRIYSLYLLFLPFKTTSGALLERNLEYPRIVRVEIADLLCGSLVTVVGAIAGLGVLSFVLGGVAGHLFGALAYFFTSRWSIGIAFSKKRLIRLAKFGLPFQTNLILGLFWGPLVLLYLGREVGSENLGFFQFAASLSVLPLAVSEIVNRVIFPLGARLQQDRTLFKKIIERSLVVVSICTLPLMMIGIASAREVILFVYTDKWLPSLPALYIGLVQTSVIAYTGIFSQLLLSRGKATYLRNMGLIWGVLTWLIAPILIRSFGFVGMSMTGLMVALSGLWLCIKLKREVNFSIFENVYPYFLSSIFAGLTTFWVLWFLPASIIFLFLAVLLGLITYVSCLLVFARLVFWENLKLIFRLSGRLK